MIVWSSRQVLIDCGVQVGEALGVWGGVGVVIVRVGPECLQPGFGLSPGGQVGIGFGVGVGVRVTHAQTRHPDVPSQLQVAFAGQVLSCWGVQVGVRLGIGVECEGVAVRVGLTVQAHVDVGLGVGVAVVARAVERPKMLAAASVRRTQMTPRVIGVLIPTLILPRPGARLAQGSFGGAWPLASTQQQGCP